MLKSYIIILIVLFLTPVCYADNQNLPHSEKRTALVIGNSNYRKVPLKNPVNDADDIGKSLKNSGFTVIKLTNSTKKEIKAGIRKFESRLSNEHVGLFFFAGHGVQVNGENYIVPVGADIISEYDIDDQCVKLSYVLGAMENAKNRMNIIILDACRNNPFRSYRSIISGLSKMDAPTGSILIYSTAPGKAAADGTGRNSIFTSSFLKFLKAPDISLTTLLMKVRKDVMFQSENTQVPWESSSLTSDFYFHHQTIIADTVELKPSIPTAKGSERHTGKLAGTWVDEWKEDGLNYYTLIRFDPNGSGYTENKIPEDPWWAQSMNWKLNENSITIYTEDQSSEYQIGFMDGRTMKLVCVKGESRGEKLTLKYFSEYQPRDLEIKIETLYGKWISKWTEDNGEKCQTVYIFKKDGHGSETGTCNNDDWNDTITWKLDSGTLYITTENRTDLFKIRCLSKKRLCLIGITPDIKYEGSTFKRKYF